MQWPSSLQLGRFARNKIELVKNSKEHQINKVVNLANISAFIFPTKAKVLEKDMRAI